MAQRQKKVSASQLKLRTDSEMKKWLEAAAEARGVSLNKEINDRLRKSFAQEHGLLGEVMPITRVLDEVMRQAGSATIFNLRLAEPRSSSWLDDPVAYRQAVNAAVETLEVLKPSGDDAWPLGDSSKAIGKGWDEVLQDVNQEFGQMVARAILDEIASGKPRSSTSVWRIEDLHRNLGDLVKRINIEKLITKKVERK